MSVQVNKVEKVGHMDLWEIVRFQIFLYCHLNRINISESDIDCLTLLCINGEVELSAFCNAACEIDERDRDHTLQVEYEIFKTPQSVRNAINKLKNLGLVIKKGKSKKKVILNPNTNIVSDGNIFVQIKFLRKDETTQA